MRLEIYPTYAKRLNRIVEDAMRRGQDRSAVWSDVLELARLMASRDRNGGLVYPVHAIAFRPGPRDKENLRQLQKLSERDRWEFLSRAALEVLRQLEAVA